MPDRPPHRLDYAAPAPHFPRGWLILLLVATLTFLGLMVGLMMYTTAGLGSPPAFSTPPSPSLPTP